MVQIIVFFLLAPFENFPNLSIYLLDWVIIHFKRSVTQFLSISISNIILEKESKENRTAAEKLI